MARKLLFLETLWRTTSALVLIRLTPYNVWRSQLGVLVPIPQLLADVGATHAPRTRLMDDVAWSHSVAARLFRKHFTCLMLALSARGMLTSRGTPSVLVLGVRLREGKLTSVRAMGAHAWIISGGTVLVGEKEMAGHTPVAAYVRRKLG